MNVFYRRPRPDAHRDDTLAEIVIEAAAPVLLIVSAVATGAMWAWHWMTTRGGAQ